MASFVQRSIRRFRYGKSIVVVSGLPRSGTSMAMKMLDAGGLDLVLDGVRTADEDNPKGYFELEAVKDLAKTDDKSWLADAKGKGVKIISTLLRELPDCYNYKVIFMRRDLEEVLASQAKMLERRGQDSGAEDELMREHFANDLWRANYLLKNEPRFEALGVHYREALNQPEREAQRIKDFLGMPLDVRKMAEVVDPDLYRNRADQLDS